MKYKCIREMCIPKCDGDGFEIPNKYGFAEIESIWQRDDVSILGGEIHLECVSGCDDFGWIEISKEDFEKNFEELN